MEAGDVVPDASHNALCSPYRLLDRAQFTQVFFTSGVHFRFHYTVLDLVILFISTVQWICPKCDSINCDSFTFHSYELSCSNYYSPLSEDNTTIDSISSHPLVFSPLRASSPRDSSPRLPQTRSYRRNKTTSKNTSNPQPPHTPPSSDSSHPQQHPPPPPPPPQIQHATSTSTGHSHHTPAADKPCSDSSNVYGLPKKSNLRILTLNCQRILGKTAELAAALKYLKPDIVCGTESWLHGIKPGANPSPDHVKSSEVFPEEYNVFRKDRNCLGCGIFILIHKSLTAVEQPELSTDCEILWAKLKLQNRKYLNVGCFYMPHRNKHDMEQLDKSLNLLTQNGKKDCPIVLAGDFNCPHINWINHTTHSTGKDNDIQQSLVDIMQSSTLTQVHHSPTRFMNILDLIFFSNPSLVKSSVSVPGISNHEMILHIKQTAQTSPARSLQDMDPPESSACPTRVETEASGQGPSAEDLRSLALTYRKPLVTIMQPLHVFLRAKFCEPDSLAMQEKLLDLHDRPVEASEQFLNWLLDEQDRSPEDLMARWYLFRRALSELHPILCEIVFDNTYDPKVLDYQLRLLNFFVDEFTEQVTPLDLVPSLYSKNLMSVESIERLQSLNDTKSRTLATIFMVCNIHRVHADWYHAFLELLVEKDYGDLVEKVDDKAYAKIMKKMASKSEAEPQTSCAQEALLEVEGAAYDPRPVTYAAAPPSDRSDEPSEQLSPSPQQKDNAEFTPADDAEETELKSFLRSNSSTESAITLQAGEEAEEEEDSDDFHSCDGCDSDDDLDLTPGNVGVAWNDPGSNASPDHGRQNIDVCSGDSNNRQRTLERKELQGKNIQLGEERCTASDNSNEDWVNPKGGEENKEVQPEPLELRPYQLELAREGLAGKNAIVVAPTGSGKTHVALKIIQSHLQQKGAGVRKVVFLVNQVALAQQQYEACLVYLTPLRVKLVTGNAGVAATEKVPFKHLLMRADIVVMTAQVLVNSLDQREVEGVCEFSLIVLDECHHTNLLHPFNSIMHYYMDVKYASTEEEEGDTPPQQLPQVCFLLLSLLLFLVL
ncbi:hypothetical protein ACOMHN_028595 [Nucella lapillus]